MFELLLSERTQRLRKTIRESVQKFYSESLDGFVKLSEIDSRLLHHRFCVYESRSRLHCAVN